jgi:hypothetical protein
VRGGYEVECHGVVEHLRRAHDVTVVTSTQGDGDEPHVRPLLPWSEDTRAGVLRAPLASLRGGLCAPVASQRPTREVGATYWVYTWVNAAGGLGHSGPGYRRSRSWCAGVKNPR